MFGDCCVVACVYFLQEKEVIFNGKEYKAVHNSGSCKGCAFEKLPVTVCNSHSEACMRMFRPDKISVIWVKK